MSLAVVQSLQDLREVVASWRRERARIGVVPTMGALHDGHLSLVRAALAEADRVVVTIFVNPKQFNNAADLANYPRAYGSDIEKLTTAGAHLLYAPDAAQMYPAGFATTISVRGVQRGAVRRIPYRPLRRRGDRRRETVSADRRRSRLLWREGLSAASSGSSNGLRLEHSHASDRVSDGSRGRWPRDVVSKRAAHAGRARGRSQTPRDSVRSRRPAFGGRRGACGDRGGRRGHQSGRLSRGGISGASSRRRPAAVASPGPPRASAGRCLARRHASH